MQEQPSFSSFPQPNDAPDYPPVQVNPQPPLAPEPPQKPHGHKGLIVTIILLVILLLGALGFIAYMLYLQPKPTEEKVNTTDTTTVDTTEKTGDADKIIATIRTALNEKILPTYKDAVISDGTMAPAYKAKDQNFAVRGNHGYSLSVDPAPTTYDEKANKTVQDVMIETLGTPSRFTVTSTSWSKIYQDDTVICEVFTDGTPVSVDCANIADYKDTIAKAKPFAEAYLASPDGKKYGNGLLLGDVSVSQKPGGYSRATVAMGSTLSPIGGYAGLFYAKDNNWTYFRGTQNIIACADYNTYDLQAAFEGDPCLSAPESTEAATVKLLLTK